MKLDRLIHFIRFNKEKILTLKAYVYSAYYRFCVLHMAMDKVKRKMGICGEESVEIETLDHFRVAKNMAHHVNRITLHTPWESKCLVRSLTLRKMLSDKGITATLYLGVGKDNDKLVAHAWLRSGAVYLTGGSGDGYVVVEKFRT